jgi:hypothetical protein
VSEKYRRPSEELVRAAAMSVNGRWAMQTTAVYQPLVDQRGKAANDQALAKQSDTLAKLLALRTRLECEDVEGALRITRELIHEEKWSGGS